MGGLGWRVDVYPGYLKPSSVVVAEFENPEGTVFADGTRMNRVTMLDDKAPL